MKHSWTIARRYMEGARWMRQYSGGPDGGQAVCWPRFFTARRRRGSHILLYQRRLPTIHLAAGCLAMVMLAAACGGGGGATASPTHRAVARKTPSGPCVIDRADVDRDGVVSIFDLTTVSAHLGQTVPPAPPELDQDGDKAITVLDLNLVTRAFVHRVDECP